MNGFINHYPDFIVMTQSGRIIWWSRRVNN